MNFKEKIKSFVVRCGRVWKIMKKPTLEEYKIISKVSILGLLIIGLLGFIISLIVHAFIH